MRFEWDEAKNDINVHKHGIDFNDVVVYAERHEDIIRIISASKASKQEVKRYDKAIKN